MGGGAYVPFNVLNYKADPLNVSDSTAAINNAITAATAGVGGYVVNPVVCTRSRARESPRRIRSADRGRSTTRSTVWNWTGTGTCFRHYSTTEAAAYPLTPASAGIFGITIDGTNATGASNGFRIGDLFQYRVDIAVQNFTIAGSNGVLFDNQYYYTEQLSGTIYAFNCVNHVVFNVGGATTSTQSFARPDLTIYINQGNANYNGVVVQNGALLYDGEIHIRGNFLNSSSAVTSAILTVTGTVPAGHGGAGQYSAIQSCNLDIQVETYYQVGWTNAPQTIVLGTPSYGNYINGCYGVMDFGLFDTPITCLLNPMSARTRRPLVTGDQSVVTAHSLQATMSTYITLTTVWLEH